MGSLAVDAHGVVITVRILPIKPAVTPWQEERALTRRLAVWPARNSCERILETRIRGVYTESSVQSRKHQNKFKRLRGCCTSWTGVGGAARRALVQ